MEVGTIINENTKYAYVIFKVTKKYFFGRFINYPKVEAKGISKPDLEDTLKDYILQGNNENYE